MRVLPASVVLSMVAACQSGPGVLNPDGGPRGGGVGQFGAGSSGGNGTGGNGGTGGGDTSGTGGGDACAEVTSMANLDKRPVDVIMIIDNSCSMTDEIQAVETNVNTNFASIIGSSGLDYRIILLSRHGPAIGQQSICISSPLSANTTCTPPPPTPSNGTNFFHYSTEIGSTDSLRKIISTYNAAGSEGTGPQGWSPWLRPNAYRTFIEITDDNEGRLSAVDFDRQLTALMPANFGTVQNRNYTFHSIVGVTPKANPDDAYQPSEPVVNSKCASAVNAGDRYQDLSKLTGGLRFQMCEPNRYGTVFRAVAQGVIASSQVACDFAVPTPPQGTTLSNRIYVAYTPGTGGAPTEFSQVANAAACAANTFYVQNMRVIFCPQTCTAVRTDPMARVAVRFSCEPMIQ